MDEPLPLPPTVLLCRCERRDKFPRIYSSVEKRKTPAREYYSRHAAVIPPCNVPPFVVVSSAREFNGRNRVEKIARRSRRLRNSLIPSREVRRNAEYGLSYFSFCDFFSARTGCSMNERFYFPRHSVLPCDESLTGSLI